VRPTSTLAHVNVLASKGFTLIELMVGLAIAVILLVLAAPAYTRWVADTQIAGGASAMADGLRFAQAEAIKRNARVEFNVSAGMWVVRLPGSSDKLRTGALGEGAAHSTLTPAPTDSTTVTFNSFGQIESENAEAPTVPLTSVDVSMTGGSKPLRVIIGNGAAGTGIKLCDPSFAWPDPKGCPAPPPPP